MTKEIEDVGATEETKVIRVKKSDKEEKGDEGKKAIRALMNTMSSREIEVGGKTKAAREIEETRTMGEIVMTREIGVAREIKGNWGDKDDENYKGGYRGNGK